MNEVTTCRIDSLPRESTRLLARQPQSLGLRPSGWALVSLLFCSWGCRGQGELKGLSVVQPRHSPIGSVASGKVYGDSPSGPAMGSGTLVGRATASGASAAEKSPAAVRFIGRTDSRDTAGVRYAWSGSGLVARFKGTGITLQLRDSGNQHTLLLDGQSLPILKTRANQELYPIASHLAAGEHVLAVYRRTEAFLGTTQYIGLIVEDGELLSPPPAPVRRLEIIGDSISCGYGLDGADPSCKFSPDTENNYLAYGSVLGRALGAEVVTVAWSGKGVVANYGGERSLRLPELYDRTLPLDASSLWDFAWQPHAVVINLGTNDFSTEHDPSEAVFATAYREFLSHVRQKYPQAFLLCTLGPLLQGNDLLAARRAIARAVDELRIAGDQSIRVYELKATNANPGCDWHPGPATQATMARELEGELRRGLGW